MKTQRFAAFLLLLAFLLCLCFPVEAQQVVRTYGADGVNYFSPTNPIPVTDLAPAGGIVPSTSIFQSTAAALPTSSTAIPFGINAKYFTITNTTAAAGSNIFISLNNTAASTGATSFEILPQQSFSYVGPPTISTINLIGSSATGGYTIVAW